MDFKKGLISVIMSNYNTPEEYLRNAVESVLNQTYADFEFIIVDDCSTDNSLEIIESYNDPRIVIIKNEVNMGITKSLNRALGSANGEYVARMDADDICLPERFRKQTEFLNAHPDTVVCGTWVELFGNGADALKENKSCKILPQKELLRINLLFGNHLNIIHPTAMFNHRLLKESGITYNEKYIYAQDYRMWAECAKIGELANVPEILFRYRIHNKAVSSDKKSAQTECAKNIMAEQLSWLGLELPDDWENVHHGLLTGRKPFDIRYKKWIKTIISANRKHKVFNHGMLKDILWRKWAEISYFAMAKQKNPFNFFRILFGIPIKYWNVILKIRNQRAV
ncbi:MAG: glycosyltransferase family 2 protein [Clostridia bacterium]|nr:glycosyltransferase family 2 protein [Clostridia bacterium]